jgi:hypothetical protein
MNRPLSQEEYELARWMLEHGTPEARDYLPQLEHAEVTPWRCPCGCASLNFRITGHAEPPPGVHVLADFLTGGEENPSGVFIFACGGVLSGIEVYGLASEAPRALPTVDDLRPFQTGAQPN